MTPETLSRAMGGSLPIAEYERKLPGILAAMRVANITTVKRAAMWCAQLGHESVGLRYYQEIASGSAYEGRRDLGNTQPGDGRRFKGHGPIQVTGRHNHTRVSEWAHAKGLVPTRTYFVDHPDELATDKWGPMSAAWYWTVARPQINTLSDGGNVREVTRQINGGYNGLSDREARYRRALALGTALLEGTDDMFEKADSERLARIEKDVAGLRKQMFNAKKRDQQLLSRLDQKTADRVKEVLADLEGEPAQEPAS